jgi:hypothetical protein
MAIVFDNAASAKGAAATLSFNLTLGNASGSNRLLVIGVSVNGGEVGIVHYDGRPAHFVGVQVDGALRTYLYYIFDVNLPAAAGTYLLEVFGSAGLTSIAAVAVAVKGAFQGAPEATAQSSVASNTSISTSISPITADAMVFDVVGTLAPSITVLTPAAGQTKRDQQDGASSDVAVSTRSFSSGGPTSVGWSFNAQATKAGHIVAVWAPAAGGTQQPGLKDIRTAVTTIVTPASSGNFTVTGVGFKGKAVFLWGVPVQGTSVAIDAAQWLGIADDASPSIRQKSVMVSSRGGVAHTRCIADRQNAISILRADVDAPVVVGNITSWNDDGFVINFTSTTAGYVIFAMVLGGADLKSYVGEANVGSGTGSVTGLPFAPDLGIAITNDASIGAAPTQTATQAFGVFDKNLNQWWVGSFHGVEDTIKRNSLLRTTTGFVGQLSKSGSPATPAVIWEARVTAVSATGFSWTGNDGDGFFYLALNLGGARAVVGSVTKSTAAAPVTQKLPDPGWKPQAYLLASAVKNNQDPTTALGNRVAIGAFSGSRQRSSLRTDLDAATNADQRANDQRVLGLGDTDATYTALARALPIVDQTPGFEWSPNDSQARLIGFLSIEQGIVSPVQLETPVRITSVKSLSAGTSTTRTADESVVLELLDSVNPTGYRLEHLTNPAQGAAGGWSLYFELTEGIVFGTGALIEVHSSSSDGDPEPRPGRTHRYKVASGPAQFVLNAGDDIVRLVRPDGVTVEEMPVMVVSDPGSGGRVVRGEVRNKADALVPGVLVEALQLTWTTLGLRETSLGRFITNAQGQYEIKYTPVDGGSTDCGPPRDEVNLVVRALAGDLIQPREELMRSGIVSPARDDETVNLVVDRAAPTSESRYVIIDRQFRRCLSTQASDQLQVWYGVRDTGATCSLPRTPQGSLPMKCWRTRRPTSSPTKSTASSRSADQTLATPSSVHSRPRPRSRSRARAEGRSWVRPSSSSPPSSWRRWSRRWIRGWSIEPSTPNCRSAPSRASRGNGA